MFLFAMVISFIFLSVLIRVNYDLDSAKRSNDSLQKQIDAIKKNDADLNDKIAAMSKNITQIAKDIDTTQELQRKQAMAIGELKKGKKH